MYNHVHVVGLWKCGVRFWNKAWATSLPRSQLDSPSCQCAQSLSSVWLPVWGILWSDGPVHYSKSSPSHLEGENATSQPSSTHNHTPFFPNSLTYPLALAIQCWFHPAAAGMEGPFVWPQLAMPSSPSKQTHLKETPSIQFFVWSQYLPHILLTKVVAMPVFPHLPVLPIRWTT